MNRFVKFLSALVPYLAAETIQYFLYSVVILSTRFITIPDELLYALSAGIIAVCGVLFFFWYHYEIRGKQRGSLRNIISPKAFSLFIILGISSQFFFTGLMTLIKPLFTEIFSDYSKVLENLTSGNEYVVLLLMIFIAPVTEELIFRGVILHRANRYIPFLGANLMQAVLFGIYHGNIIQGVYATLLGFLLGTVYYKYKTLFAPILLHMIINASSLLAVLIPDILLSYVILTIAGGIVIIVALFIMKPTRPITLQEVREEKQE
jgi:membrane protease YdiL (CAAX protease family)